jgi:hypothetical protein
MMAALMVDALHASGDSRRPTRQKGRGGNTTQIQAPPPTYSAVLPISSTSQHWTLVDALYAGSDTDYDDWVADFLYKVWKMAGESYEKEEDRKRFLLETYGSLSSEAREQVRRIQADAKDRQTPDLTPPVPYP